MLFADVTAEGLVLIIGAVFLGITQLVSLILQFLSRNDNSEVKSTLKTNTARTNQKLDGISKGTEEIHALVNGNMSVQLQINMRMAKRLASLPGATAEDIKAAEDATRAYEEHEKSMKEMEDRSARGAAAVEDLADQTRQLKEQHQRTDAREKEAGR